MGNQTSFDQRNYDKLLRRNMRSAFTHVVNGAGYLDNDSQRQVRSRSLEPHATQEIRGIEHSKSARYSKHGVKHRRVPTMQLWNPEEQRLQLIKQQLQNPLSVCGGMAAAASTPASIASISQLQDDEFRQQLKRFVASNQRRTSTNLNNNLTEQEQLHRSITGLTVHQTQILQKMWARATEMEVFDCTRNIFAHLLRSNMQMYHFFDLVGMTDREIVGSAIFVRQSANFAMVFDYVITNLVDVEKVCFALQCLGERHTRLKYPIDQTHWALFTRVFEDNPPKLVFQNAEGHSVWKSMVGFIVKQMRIGYDRASAAITTTEALTRMLSVTEPMTPTAMSRPKSAQASYGGDASSTTSHTQRRQKHRVNSTSSKRSTAEAFDCV